MKKIIATIFLMLAAFSLVLINNLSVASTNSDNIIQASLPSENSLQLTPAIKNALVNGTFINMTIEDIVLSQSFVHLGTENSFISSLPVHQKAYLLPQMSNNQVTKYILMHNNENFIISDLHSFSIEAPGYHEYATINNQTYQIRPMNWEFFSGSIMGANSSHVVISVLDHVPMAINGQAEFSGFNGTGDYIDRLIGFDYKGIPSIIQNTTTKILASKNIFEQIGDFQENKTIISHTQISPANFSSLASISSLSLVKDSFTSTSSLAFTSTSSLAFTSTTDQEMSAGINLYIDSYLANDPTNGLYINPTWSDMYSYMDSPVSGESWMPYVQMHLQNTYYGNPPSNPPNCFYNYGSDWITFIRSFAQCGVNHDLQGGSNDNVDASFIMSGYQNFQGGDYGDSFYFPSSGSSWGVFGYYNSQKDSGAYAGVANGYWVAGNVAMRIAHEFGHLMGGSHEDGQGAVSGPSGWPGHGATTYCTGLLCYFHIGYKHSIMWHTTLDQNLVRNWAFSSNSWSSGYYTFTKSSYNSDVNHDNLFYVRGTVWYYCRNA